MDLNKLFELIDGLLGDIGTFQGLSFSLPNGILIIDFVKGVEYELADGSTDIVDGFVLDFVPFDELLTPVSYLAFDEAGLKYLISEFILE